MILPDNGLKREKKRWEKNCKLQKIGILTLNKRAQINPEISLKILLRKIINWWSKDRYSN